MSKKNSEHCGKFFDKVVKTVFYLSGKRLWEKTSSQEIFLNSWAVPELEQKSLRVLAQTGRQACRNSILCVKRNVLRIFLQKKIFESLNVFRKWTKNFVLWLESSSSFVKTATYLSRRTFGQINFFERIPFFKLLSDFGQNTFDHLLKNFRYGCQICTLPSSGAFWENSSFGRKISNFWVFQTYCLKVLDFIQKRFLQSCQNCNLPEELFAEIIFRNYFWFFINTLRPFCKKVSGRFVQTVFHLSKGNFKEVFFQRFFV